MIAAKFTSNGQFAGATYAYVSPTAGGGPLIAVAPSGAIMLAQGAPNWTVISIFPWLTVENATPLAAGEIVTLRGYGLGPATAAAGSGGTQVTFDGIAAPVFSAQSQQVTAQGDRRPESTEVFVTYNGGPSVGTTASAPAVVAPAAPGIFAVANSDEMLNSAKNPAKAGDSITIYGTGVGVTNPLGITGGLWPIARIASGSGGASLRYDRGYECPGLSTPDRLPRSNPDTSKLTSLGRRAFGLRR